MGVSVGSVILEKKEFKSEPRNSTSSSLSILPLEGTGNLDDNVL